MSGQVQRAISLIIFIVWRQQDLTNKGLKSYVHMDSDKTRNNNYFFVFRG